MGVRPTVSPEARRRSEGFDPGLYTGGQTFDASSRTAYNRLVEFKHGGTELEPGLAESYEVSADGKEYTFEVLDAIETDTGRYLAMLPIYDDPQKALDDSGELVIVKVGEEEENGDEYYYEIEDDDEYEMIADAFVERLEDFFEIDEG